MNVLKRLFLLLIFITSFMLIYTVLYPNIEVSNKEVLVGTTYTPKVKVYNLFTNLNNKLIIDNKVDINKVGTSYIECRVNYLFYKVNKKIAINVVDKTKPLITLKGNNPSYVCPLKDYEEEGYEAIDNYDGDITEKVNTNKIDSSIWYEVEDSSHNQIRVERKIIFEDQESPSLTLKGGNVITIYVGSSYNESGYTASDNCDGDITDKVQTEGNVDTSKAGVYEIKYTVTDSSNNTKEVTRKIIVKSRPSYYGNGVIYLTFDDGPSNLTGRILDILDEENIKATFFVTRGGEYVKRAYNSGHTIALHTYTHNYSYVYSSVDNYFADLNNVSDSVYNSIGIHPKIIRFPGGSSNVVSKHYSSGIMTRLTSEVVNRGYNYFDWNVDSNDAGGDGANSSKIYNNVINGLSHNKTNIVLMHDSGSHTATVNTLKNIIDYGKKQGYSFKAITNDTPSVRHGVNN